MAWIYYTIHNNTWVTMVTTWCVHVVMTHVILHVTLPRITVAAGGPSTPQNLTLDSVTSSTATLHWEVDELNNHNHVHPTSAFQMTVESVHGTVRSARVTEPLPGSDREHTISWLIPETEYRVSMRAYDGDGNRSNSSGVLVFRTLARKPGGLVIHPGEAIVILLMLAAWFLAMLNFVNKWSKLRIMQPRAQNWKQQPKNIESIRVVKRHQDSVIYRTYSKRVSATMQQRAHREKRFQRMVTMPNITLPPELQNNLGEQEAVKAVPLLEVDETSTDGSSA